MGLGNILGGLQGVLGTIGQVGAGTQYGTVAQIGSSFLSGFLPAQGPIRTAQQSYPSPVMTMAAAPTITRAVTAAAANVQGVLIKMAQAIGSVPSVKRAMAIVRRLMGVLGSAEATAIALGLSIAELGILATANAAKPRRRMNPGNVKALRRAHRRLESFHRLCGKNDQLRTRRRSTRKAPITINTTGRVCN